MTEPIFRTQPRWQLACALLIGAALSGTDAGAAESPAGESAGRIQRPIQGLYRAVRWSSLPSTWSFKDQIDRRYFVPGQPDGEAPYRCSSVIVDHGKRKKYLALSSQWDARHQHLFVSISTLPKTGEASPSGLSLDYALGCQLSNLKIDSNALRSVSVRLPSAALSLDQKELGRDLASLQNSYAGRELTACLARKGYQVIGAELSSVGAQSELLLALAPNQAGVPASSVQAVQETLAAARSRVAEVPVKPLIQATSDLRIQAPGDGVVAHYIRHYDAGQRRFIVEYDWRNGAPAWAPVSKALELVAGKGIPTTTLATLLQMRTLGIREGTLRSSLVMEVCNERSVIDLSRRRSERLSADQIVAGTNTFQYMETALIQSGHAISGVRINGSRPLELGSSDDRIIDYDMLLELQPAGSPSWPAK